jgi:hypothetical protein
MLLLGVRKNKNS